MKKNTLIIILASALTVTIGCSIFFFNQSNTVSMHSKFDSDRAFSEFISGISKIDTALSKSVYSTTPAYSVTMFAEVYSQAEMAKSNLAQLNDEENAMSDTYHFISTVGDYSLAMLKKVANGEEISVEEQESIEMLAKKTEQLAVELSDIKTSYNNGDIDDYIMNITVFDTSELKNPDESEIETELQEFATLIYDGPFSSHIDKIEPELLKYANEISKEQALELVAEFLDTDLDQVEYISQVTGQISFYKFKSFKDDDEITIDITVKGGHILNFINYRDVGEETKSFAECLEIAKGMLQSNGYSNIAETYYVETDQTVTINFAFTQENVILYPDLLKLEIYKDDGTLAGVEARGFIMSHRIREDVSPEISISQARTVVSEKLSIISENLTIIPSSGQNEVLAYEFKCKNENDDNYIVYVNAKTGQIQNMLILIEDETGTLAM